MLSTSTLLLLLLVALTTLVMHQIYTIYTIQSTNYFSYNTTTTATIDNVDSLFIIGYNICWINKTDGQYFQGLIYTAILLLIIIKVHIFSWIAASVNMAFHDYCQLVRRSMNLIIQIVLLFTSVVMTDGSEHSQNQQSLFVRFIVLLMLQLQHQVLSSQARIYIKDNDASHMSYSNSCTIKRFRLLIGILIIFFIDAQLVYYFMSKIQHPTDLTQLLFNKAGWQLMPTIFTFLLLTIPISHLSISIQYMHNFYTYYINPINCINPLTTISSSNQQPLLEQQQPNYIQLEHQQSQQLLVEFIASVLQIVIDCSLWIIGVVIYTNALYLAAVNVSYRVNLYARQVMQIWRVLILDRKIRQYQTKSNQIQKMKQQHKNKDKTEQLCTVCFWGFNKDASSVQLSCQHKFHSYCVKQWILKSRKSTCPQCKKIILFEENTIDKKINQYATSRQRIRAQGKLIELCRQKADVNMLAATTQNQQKNLQKLSINQHIIIQSIQQVQTKQKGQKCNKKKRQKDREYVGTAFDIDLVQICGINYIGLNKKVVDRKQKGIYGLRLMQRSNKAFRQKIGSLPFSFPRQAVYNRTKQDMQLRQQQMQSNSKIIKLLEMNPTKQMLLIPQL